MLMIDHIYKIFGSFNSFNHGVTGKYTGGSMGRIRRYSAEFKLKAIALADKYRSVKKAADELGIKQSTIRTFKEHQKLGKL